MSGKNKIIIFGGSGMLGSAIYKYFSKNTKFKIVATSNSYIDEIDFFDGNLIKIDIQNHNEVLNLIKSNRPNFIINCIGIIKQLKDINSSYSSIFVNSLFPHLLDDYSKKFNFKLVHFSTDCVFSGNKGNYQDSDLSDVNDLYGLSKKLGEIYNSKNSLTLRTSIIGNELYRKKSLMDWFINEEKIIYGYKNAYFSGFTTIEIAKILKIIFDKFTPGLYNLSSHRIDKFSLLNKINKIYGLGKKIEIDNEFKIDRSLDSTLFRKLYNYTPPTWDSMITESHKYYAYYKK